MVILDLLMRADRHYTWIGLNLVPFKHEGGILPEDIYDRIEWNDQRFKTTIRDLCGLLLVVIDSKQLRARELMVGNIPWCQKHLTGFLQNPARYILSKISQKVPSTYLDYATHNWTSHFRVSSIQSDDPIVTERGLAICEPESDTSKTCQRVARDIPCVNSLMVASHLGLVGIVHKLLWIGKVDIDPKDSHCGYTPLSLAAKNGHEAVVRLLLDTGEVDVNSKNHDGWTPLSIAAGHRYETVVRLLLDTGEVDVNSKNYDGWKPLSLAVLNEDEAVVKLLLDTGEVDVNQKVCDGQTPLSLAARYGFETVVRLLLGTKKVDIKSKDFYGETPYSLAARNGDKAVMRLLEHSMQIANQSISVQNR